MIALCLGGCSSSTDDRNLVRIGIDSGWHEIRLHGQEAYVNGFLEDLLMAVAKYSGLKFECIQANWDSILPNLLKGEYDLMISALPAYEFYQDRLAFSHNFLDLGPVLVLPLQSRVEALSHLEGKLVGFQSHSSQLVLQAYPQLVWRGYDSPVLLLNAVAEGEIDAALIDPLQGVNYVQNLFQGQLRVLDVPLNREGIRCIAEKEREESDYWLQVINRSIEHLHRQGTLDALKQKWQLGYVPPGG